MPESSGRISGAATAEIRSFGAPPSYAEHRTFVPTKRRIRLSEIWASRHIARIAALRDTRVKYKQSLLGPIWLVLQPMGLLIAVLVAFSGVTHTNTGGVSPLLFTLVGVTVWTFVGATISSGTTSMIANAALVRRSACPRTALVIGAILTNLPTLAVMTCLSIVLALIINGPFVQMLLLPLLLLWTLVLLWGPCMVLAGIATRYRDTVAVVPMLMQAGAFLSPVGYSIDSAPHYLQILLLLNPAAGLIEIWRWSMLGIAPVAGAVISCVLETVVLAYVGWRIFSRAETTFADYL
jgi:ABC-type polysaccharide/polyol phosphate export permease